MRYDENMKITIEQLEKLNACEGQVKTFKKLFGKSATVTKANCLKACKAGLDFNWASRLLSPKAREVYEEAIAPVWKVYEEAIAPAWKVYREAIAPAWKVYCEAIAPAREVYQETIAPAWKVYEEAIAPAREVYEEAIAKAFWEASE